MSPRKSSWCPHSPAVILERFFRCRTWIPPCDFRRHQVALAWRKRHGDTWPNRPNQAIMGIYYAYVCIYIYVIYKISTTEVGRQQTNIRDITAPVTGNWKWGWIYNYSMGINQQEWWFGGRGKPHCSQQLPNDIFLGRVWHQHIGCQGCAVTVTKHTCTLWAMSPVPGCSEYYNQQK